MSIGPAARGVIYRFDAFELLPEREELRKHGSLVHLSPQAFRVLLLLLTRRGEIVTRAELQEALWSDGKFVDYEQGINTVIRRIRHALNDRAEAPRYLQTLPRRGYSFVGNAECIDRDELMTSLEAMLAPPAQDRDSEPPPPPRPSLQRRASVAFLLVLLLGAHGPVVRKSNSSDPHVLRVAVLPARTIGPAGIDPRLFDSALQSRIAQMHPLKIRVVEANNTPDVSIETTLTRLRDTTRVDARMLDAKNAREVWSETFNRQNGDGVDFPYEVSLRVKNAVARRYLPPARSEPLIRSKVSPAALALYRRARVERSQVMGQRDFDRAIALFEQALQADPRFAEAWSGIGDIWMERASILMFDEQAKALANARTALRRALQIDPLSIEANNDYGLLVWRYDRDYGAAERLIHKSLEGDPDYLDANINLAMLLGAMGNSDASIAQFRHAQWLDPVGLSPSPTAALLYLMGRRYDDAAAEYRTLLLVSRYPQGALWGLMYSAIAAGRWDEAAHQLSQLVEKPIVLTANGVPAREFRQAYCLLEQGLLERERARQIDPYVLACYYAGRDDPDRALAALDRAIDDHSPTVTFAAVDPRLDPLRRDARFAERLRRLRLIE